MARPSRSVAAGVSRGVSDVRFWRATTVALAARGATNSVDVQPAVKIMPGLWSWTGGLDWVIVGGYYGRKSITDYGSSIDGNISDTSVQDCKFCHGRSRRRGDIICRRTLSRLLSRADHASCARYLCKRRLIPRIGGGLPDHVSFNHRASMTAVLAEVSVVRFIAGVGRGRPRAPQKHPITDYFPLALLSCLAPTRANSDGVGSR